MLIEVLRWGWEEGVVSFLLLYVRRFDLGYDVFLLIVRSIPFGVRLEAVVSFTIFLIFSLMSCQVFPLANRKNVAW